MFNILLISGHTRGHNKMANGSRNEGDLNIEVVNLLKPRLEKLKDVNVYVYDMNRNTFYDVQNGVFKRHLPAVRIDYVLEVHFNALNGKSNLDGKKKGSEIFVTTREQGIKVEQAIMRHMDDFFPLRDNDGVHDGVKRENFAVINTLKSMGISGALLEVCFYDDEDDMAVYYANKDAIADGIVAGIAEGFELEKEAAPDNPAEPKPEKPASLKYKVGDRVKVSSYYVSSTDPISKAVIKNEEGVITRIESGARNPYLIDDGRVGWCNDGDIRGKVAAVAYYKAFTNKSFVDGLKSIGVSATFAKRKKIADANGITNYTGTAAQNSKLLSLARAGKLKKA